MKKIKRIIKLLKLIVVIAFTSFAVGMCGGLPFPQSNRKQDREIAKIEMVETINTESEIIVESEEKK